MTQFDDNDKKIEKILESQKIKKVPGSIKLNFKADVMKEIEGLEPKKEKVGLWERLVNFRLPEIRFSAPAFRLPLGVVTVLGLSFAVWSIVFTSPSNVNTPAQLIQTNPNLNTSIKSSELSIDEEILLLEEFVDIEESLVEDFFDYQA